VNHRFTGAITIREIEMTLYQTLYAAAAFLSCAGAVRVAARYWPCRPFRRLMLPRLDPWWGRDLRTAGFAVFMIVTPLVIFGDVVASTAHWSIAFLLIVAAVAFEIAVINVLNLLSGDA
jgi:hypothetical protein